MPTPYDTLLTHVLSADGALRTDPELRRLTKQAQAALERGEYRTAAAILSLLDQHLAQVAPAVQQTARYEELYFEALRYRGS